MMQLDIVWANARYEMTTLFRGWFFRIFAGLMITIFIIYDIIFFSTAINVPRLFYGLSASTAYANMMMLNLAQIAVIVFLATDLFKRDKRTNTTEVFYIRPMTNGAYIIGKTLGILAVFALLNFFVLCLGGVIHFVFGDVNFNGTAYFLNYLLLPFPAFIFILGLSIFLMHLIKNQAVVVLLLLGYFAAVLFYLRDQWHYIFDFVAINLPMFYSDFVGIANLEIICFIGITIYFINGCIIYPPAAISPFKTDINRSDICFFSSIRFLRIPVSQLFYKSPRTSAADA
jgi:hypothetical protein